MDGLFGLFLITITASALLFEYYRPESRTRRALSRTEVVSIAAVRDGAVVKIIGTVRYGERTVKSSLTGRTCAYYTVIVDKISPQSTELIREADGADFFVADDSGVALIRFGAIRPAAALVNDRRRSTSTFFGDVILERFMKARGQSAEGILGFKDLRAYEGVVEAGERVAVVGLARWIADPDAAGGGYRETPKRLVLEATEAAPLLLSDDPSVVR